MDNEKQLIVRDDQGNTWLVKPSALSSFESNNRLTDQTMIELPPLLVPRPPVKFSARNLIVPASIFVGVFILIIVAFNFPALAKNITFATTHTTEKDNQQLTDQYRSLYGFASHPELSNLYPSYQPQSNPAPVTSQGEQNLELNIPKLSLTAPVLTVPNDQDATILAALKGGVVMYPGSVTPGQPGQTVIVGHSSSLPPWTKYSAIFAKLGSLEADDLIYLTVNGQEYIYRVTAVRRGSVQDILSSGMTGDLILSTCWPVGTDTNRVAVSAIRIK